MVSYLLYVLPPPYDYSSLAHVRFLYSIAIEVSVNDPAHASRKS